MKKEVFTNIQKFPRQAYYQLLIGFVIAAGSLVLFSKWVNEILEKETTAFDQQAYLWFQSWQTPAVDVFMIWMTLTGAAISVIGLSVIILLWLYFFKKNTHAIKLFLISNIGGILLNNLLKIGLQRDRPSLDPGIGAIGYSLPSGHAMGAMIFYGFIAYLLLRSNQKKWLKSTGTCLSILFILAIGVSRIYLNAHFASDVLAGYIAGGFWLSACILAVEARPWYRKYAHPED